MGGVLLSRTYDGRSPSFPYVRWPESVFSVRTMYGVRLDSDEDEEAPEVTIYTKYCRLFKVNAEGIAQNHPNICAVNENRKYNTTPSQKTKTSFQTELAAPEMKAKQSSVIKEFLMIVYPLKKFIEQKELEAKKEWERCMHLKQQQQSSRQPLARKN